MPYEFLTNKEIDLKRLGYENASLQLDFDPEKSYLRIIAVMNEEIANNHDDLMEFLKERMTDGA